MRAIIADTGPLYAAIDLADQYHSRVQNDLERVEREKLTVVIPFPVLLETYNLLLYRLGTPQAISFVKQCLETACFINPSQEQYFLAAEKAAQFSDQQITLCDAVTAILGSSELLVKRSRSEMDDDDFEDSFLSHNKTLTQQF